MNNKSRKLFAEISVGELYDKLSILEIKLKKITKKNSHKEVKKEYLILKNIEANLSKNKKNNKIIKLFKILKKINLSLWTIEDKIRICEKNKDFSKVFIKLARNVYLNNDQRAQTKSKINQLYGSNIREIKQYDKY
tara:strand:- start:962 stop:1369 length:408 start_codon:yes stop_codon:yes gene_type:complete